MKKRSQFATSNQGRCFHVCGKSCMSFFLTKNVFGILSRMQKKSGSSFEISKSLESLQLAWEKGMFRTKYTNCFRYTPTCVGKSTRKSEEKSMCQVYSHSRGKSTGSRYPQTFGQVYSHSRGKKTQYLWTKRAF